MSVIFPPLEWLFAYLASAFYNSNFGNGFVLGMFYGVFIAGLSIGLVLYLRKK